jgi:hypothetical protein
VNDDQRRWQRVWQLFQATLDRPDADRARFLRDSCAADTNLRQQVESLLETRGAATDAMILRALDGLDASLDNGFV